MFRYSPGKRIFPFVKWSFLYLNLCPFLLVLSQGNSEESLALSSWFSLAGIYTCWLISLLLSSLSSVCLSDALNHLLDLLQHVYISFALGSQELDSELHMYLTGDMMLSFNLPGFHSCQFCLNVNSSVSWSILWGTWELSTQICCAISCGCCKVLVSLGFASLLFSCYVLTPQ